MTRKRKIPKGKLSILLFILVVIITIIFELGDMGENSENEDAYINDAIKQGKLLDGYYEVVKVVDGDTVVISMNGKEEKLRLIGINTPETVDPRKPVECFGREASKKAKELLEGEEVKIELDSSQGERGKYGRILCYIFLKDNTNFNKLMISEGYAYEYTYDKPYKYQQEFKQAEKEARENKRGLWGDEACVEFDASE